VKSFLESQLLQIQQGGWAVLFRKMKRILLILLKLPFYLIVVLVLIGLRLIRPWLLVRWSGLISSRLGHFAGNTELYLCEQDAGINVPKKRYVDLFYMGYRPICNQQLAKMWNRTLRVWPSWLLEPINRVNRFIPGGAVHDIGNNSHIDRDVHNLLDRFPCHLEFSSEEISLGEAGMRMMGISPGTPFVCLIVRDSAYLDAHQPIDWSYHNYRDCDIQNYILAAEALAARGYYVIRMGAKVRNAIKTSHPRIIDYAMNGMRSDFMDIYLGAKCEFCISVGTGFDAIPNMFRRPIVYTNMVPLCYLFTFRTQFLGITKHHYSVTENRELMLSEIFNYDIGFFVRTSEYIAKGIKLIENTPKEILDVVIEMAERLNGTWQPGKDDEVLQRRFWEIFPTDALDADQGRPLHGEVRSRFGAHFLRNNRDWLQ
jgi:putative glycosyltransferase (TIGR04372 family)